MLLSANWYFHLYADDSYLDRARRAIRGRLASEAAAGDRPGPGRGA